MNLPAEVWFWVLLLIALLLALILLLVSWFRRRHDEKEYETHRCLEIPPDVARRPDPCLYSQPYLMAKGLAVTWDNPDIQITTPNGIPVPSFDLLPNTDYVVEATIHNASFDPALGVEVRCFYRPWSFGTPDRVPIELDANGNAAVRFLHIGAWGQALAKFKWRTPKVADAHFCLQVECFHPADREPNNNLGQENTQTGKAASDVELLIPLFNFRDRRSEIFISANEYVIPSGKVRLHLNQIRGPKGVERDRIRAQQASVGDQESLEQTVERDALSGARIRLSTQGRRDARGIGYRLFGYDGLQEIIADNSLGDFPLRNEWALEVSDATRDGEAWRLELAPKTSKITEVRIRVPNETPQGQQKAVNIWATDRLGALLGGVTVYVRKEA